MASRQTTLIQIPSKFGPAQRQAIGIEIINLIKVRTSNGLDINSRKFKAYSKSYKEDKDFKTANKSSRVNLRLSGEMLSDIEIVRHGRGFIVIGFDAGTDTNDKAFFSSEKGREFLGISQRDLSKILNSIPSEGSTEVADILEVPTLTRRILDRLRGQS